MSLLRLSYRARLLRGSTAPIYCVSPARTYRHACLPSLPTASTCPRFPTEPTHSICPQRLPAAPADCVGLLHPMSASLPNTPSASAFRTLPNPACLLGAAY